MSALRIINKSVHLDLLQNCMYTCDAQCATKIKHLGLNNKWA